MRRALVGQLHNAAFQCDAGAVPWGRAGIAKDRATIAKSPRYVYSARTRVG